ncbi:MAG TPA: hypothetical protein VIZ30_00815, partial [Pseudomonadales bacterium]
MAATRSPSFVELLACPRCTKPLVADERLRCDHCHVDFPDLNGVPCLFAEPVAALAEWRLRMSRLLRQTEADAAKTSRALEAKQLHPLTRRRLELFAHAYQAHHGELGRLLAPLDLGDTAPALQTHLALRTRLPPTQGLTTYYANLHRDWCWGHEENEASYALVAGGLGDCTGARVLVLGAGAGRLAYDIHTRLSPRVTVALDVNPLLALTAQQVVAGEPVALHEFPLAPRQLDDGAVARVLTAPAPVTEGFHYVLADGLRAP